MLPARVTAVTLGVRDLAAVRDFYARLGWSLEVSLDDFAAFRTRGLVLTLYALDALAADAHAEPPAPGFRGINLAINLGSREQVDEAIEEVRAAGGRIATEPEDKDFGGRSAYFADPEDNYWEVVWVPPDSRVAELIREAGHEL